MKVFDCQRCGAERFEGGSIGCSNCGYASEKEVAADLPIPSWVLKHLDMTPELATEIEEINFGFRPIRIPIPHQQSEDEAAMPEPLPLVRPDLPSRHYETFPRSYDSRELNPLIETGQCVA